MPNDPLSPLPKDLVVLFPTGQAAGYTLGVTLPAGRTYPPSPEGEESAVLWFSDAPPPVGLWGRLRAEHPRSGLWPLLVDSGQERAQDAPGVVRGPWWHDDVVSFDLAEVDERGAAEVLEGLYDTEDDDDEDDDEAGYHAHRSPYGGNWPGLAPALPLRHDPAQLADAYADELLTLRPWLRLILVPASRGADALAGAGWGDALANYTDDRAGQVAVVRSWEKRFGACLVAAGDDELFLSIASPPFDHAEALPIAAEHMAFCPDQIDQAGAGNIWEHAEELIDATSWRFWWD